MIQFFTTNLSKVIFVFLITLISSIEATHAQTPYFITNNNDTVKCSSLTAATFKPIFKYKLREDDTTRSILVSAVKEYREAKVVYTRRWVPKFNNSLFLQWYMRGKLNVYVWVTPNVYVNNIDYYAGRSDDSSAYEIKTNGFIFGTRSERRSAFMTLIADAPEVAERFIADSMYTVKNLLATLRNYNLYHSDGDIFFVNKKNDTTRCKIIFDKDDLLLYKIPAVAGLKPLKTDSLNAYVIGKTVYFRQTLPERDGPQFITQIFKGKLNTYADLEGNLYISKPGVEYVKVKGKKDSPKHKNTFFYLIADKPEMVAKYKSERYNDENLIKMIKEYNGDKI